MEKTLPLYIKVSLFLIGLCALGLIMVVGQHILLPICYSFLFAIILEPAVVRLERWRVPRTLAIAITVLLALFVAFIVVYFITYQLQSFSSSLPQLKAKFEDIYIEAKNWAALKMHMPLEQVEARVDKMQSNALNGSGVIISHALTTLPAKLLDAVLIPIYVFMILYYKSLLLGFMLRVFDKSRHTAVSGIMQQCRKMIGSYLVGVMIETLIVAVLNSTVLLVLGIDYAILMGVLGAMLNVIPLIGGLCAVIPPVLIAIVTKDSYSTALIVMAAYMTIQFIDNHYLVPRVVASRVRLNALTSVIVVLVGGAIWGVAGMFLAIPVTAIIKIIFDSVSPLEPWGYLLGDDVPVSKMFRPKPKALKE